MTSNRFKILNYDKQLDKNNWFVIKSIIIRMNKK